MERYSKPIGPCRKCGCKKKDNFYLTNKSLCKNCVKSYQQKHRAKNLDEIQAYDRERGNLPHRKALRDKVYKRWRSDPKLKRLMWDRSKEWRERNIIKRAAHLLVQNAAHRGDMIKGKCEVCGIKKVEAHHDDYAKPLEVRWLCRKHHMNHHKNEREINRLSKTRMA